jgi:hypothetical protein
MVDTLRITCTQCTREGRDVTANWVINVETEGGPLQMLRCTQCKAGTLAQFQPGMVIFCGRIVSVSVHTL